MFCSLGQEAKEPLFKVRQVFHRRIVIAVWMDVSSVFLFTSTVGIDGQGRMRVVKWRSF